MKFSSVGLGDPDSACWRRRQGDGLTAGLGASVLVELPLGASLAPVGGQDHLVGDWPAEIVGCIAGEPTVEQVAPPDRIPVGAFHLVPLGHGLKVEPNAPGGVESGMVSFQVSVGQVCFRSFAVHLPGDDCIHFAMFMFGRGDAPSAVRVGVQVGADRPAEADVIGPGILGEGDHAGMAVVVAAGGASQFAVLVVSPAVEVAVRADGHGMGIACADLGEFCNACWCRHPAWFGVV